MMNKKIMILVILMCVISLLNVIVINKRLYNKNTVLDEVKLKDEKENNKGLAIMVEKKDKTGYEVYENSTWPTKGYEYNSELSGCMDNNGNIIENSLSYNRETNMVTVITNVTSSCYLYFDLDKVLPSTFTFYLGGSSNPTYVTSTNTKAYISWSDEDIEEYCLITESDSSKCTWNKVTGQTMEIDYTLSSEDGEKIVYAYLKDMAGNISPEVSDSIILDGTGPSGGSVSINNNAAYTTSTSVTLTLSSSGATEMCISNTETCTSWEDYATSKSHTLTSGLGSKTVYVQYKDAAGNISEVVSDTIQLVEALTIPTQSGILTYTGNSQTPSWSNYNSSKMTISGTTTGTNAGSYNATFTPKTNYIWSDGTTGVKTVSWSIGKTSGSLSVSPTTLSLTPGSTGTITATISGDGKVSATSSNTGVATVSVSGTKVTVTAKASGSATITVSVAAGTNHSAPTNKTVSITVSNPFGEYLISKKTTGWNSTASGGMYRYVGTTANNYVKLGDILYRVIGVTSAANSTLGLSANQVKVIKATNIGTYNWHTSYYDTKWNNSALYTYLQGSNVLGSTSVIPSGWSDKISSVKWYIGDVNSFELKNASTVYELENDAYTSVASKIGLLYLSDHYYAYNAGGTSTCTSTYGIYCMNWIISETATYNWTMTRYGYNSTFGGYYAWFLRNDGMVDTHLLNEKYNKIRPVFYLSTSVNWKSGTGTSGDPFIVQ